MALGLLALFGIGSMNIARSVRDGIKDAEYRTTRLNPNGLTWIDHNQCTRLVSNGHKAMYTYSFYNRFGGEKGDLLLIDIEKEWKLVKNFGIDTRKEKQKKYKQDCEKHSTYYTSEDEHNSIYEDMKGMRFFDKETGTELTIRLYKSKVYYVDINTGLLVRETDAEIELVKNGLSEQGEDINKLNEEIKTMQKQFNKKDVIFLSYVNGKGISKLYI